MKVSWEHQCGTRQDAPEWVGDLRVVLTAVERDTLRRYAHRARGYPVMADYVVDGLKWLLDEALDHAVDEGLGPTGPTTLTIPNVT